MTRGEDLTEIVRLEGEIDRQLPDRRKAAVSFGWRDAARQWADAIWKRAETLGPARLDAGLVEHCVACAARPIFICGAHRSGTTLLRDLLDGHPALVVLPSEATFFTSLERKFAGLPAAALAAACGREWLCRIANPNNQPRYWLLGRSDAAGSPYLDFVREFLAWYAASGTRTHGANPSWPLAAFALAYARSGADAPKVAGAWRWVEKSPGNERFLARIWRDFEGAQVLHIIRRPADVAASHAGLMRGAAPKAARSNAALRKMIVSYLLAARHLRRAAPDRYRIVRYEQLVAAPHEVMADLAVFLGIDPAPILFRPTVTGRPTTINTSFPDGKRAAFRPAGLRARLHLAVAEWSYRRLSRHLE